MRKCLLLAVATIFLGVIPIQAQNQVEEFVVLSETSVQNDWMEQLDDNRLVTDLSLPGTHDAATAEGWSGLADVNLGSALFGDLMARAQDLTIAEQWAVGVRVFDIRPQKDEDVLRCMHGISGTKLLVGDFFAEIRDLLAASPTEFAIVATKIDTTAGEPEVVEWAPMFSALIQSDSLRQCFVEFNPRLTVEDVRGKILLLSRNKYADVPLGGFITGWSSDKDFANQQGGTITGSDGSSCPLWMQDYYEPNSDREGKDQAILRMLDATMARDLTVDNPAWVMNYTAGNTQTFLSDGYRENAVYAHQVMLDYLADESHNGSTGIVFMDYAGVDVSKSATSDEMFNVKGLQLVQALIAQNFRQTPTGIVSIENDYLRVGNGADVWYTLDGRKLPGKPTQKGIYINSGKKIFVK